MATLTQSRAGTYRTTRTWSLRLLRLLLVLFIVTFGTTALIALSPGDPAVTIAGDSAPPEVLQAVRDKYGFDDPMIQNWWDWTSSAVRGDLGESDFLQRPVIEVIGERLPITAELTILSMLMTVIVAVPAGLYAAYRRGSWVDRLINAMTSALIAVPSFVIGLVLVLALAIGTGWFPTSNWSYIEEGLGANLTSAFLPALSLALVEIAILTPILRADAVSSLTHDYIALARAKGISTTRLLFLHVLRPSSISLVTLLGLALGRLFGGAIVIEVVFNLPGLGTQLVSAVRDKDLILIQGLVAFIAVLYVVANLVVDLLIPKLYPGTNAS